ncbi:MAG TPA: crossover junction endodeoxyribonuclease RuvC [Rectinemataceae bacterium]|nr:crossover junction endodeoxyribonuclease RuvC [Rectinemataceae bacterium]
MGIDPGLASLGWGLVEVEGGRLRHLAHGIVETGKDEGMDKRLLSLAAAIDGLVAEWKPSTVGMENLFFWKNVSSAFPVAEARGAIRLTLARAGVEVVDFSPTIIKQAVVGSARAEKRQVQEMVKLLLGLPEIPKPDHAADALAAAICRYHHAKMPSPLGNPEAPSPRDKERHADTSLRTQASPRPRRRGPA